MTTADNDDDDANEKIPERKPNGHIMDEMPSETSDVPGEI